MIGKDSSLLGIDIHENEIRVVQVKSRSGKCSIVKVGRAALQAGAVVRGKIMYPNSVAVALRLLLNSMEIGAGRAVVGVMGDTTALRTLPIPPVPEGDLPMVVAGEVEHYGLVQTEGGTHAFLRLHQPEFGDPDSKTGQSTPKPSIGDDAKPVHVTIVALEEDVIASIKQTIEEANLAVEAIEPTQYGMYRAALCLAGLNANAMLLMVNPANTDVAIVYNGNLAAYRRIDIGSRAMLYNFPVFDGQEFAPLDPNAMIELGESTSPQSTQYELENVSVDNLSIEIQRTLDYYQREFPSVPIGDHLYLVIDDVRLEQLASELGQRLGADVEAVRPSAGGGDNAEALTSIAADSGPIYSGAFGLVALGPVLNKVARIDLFTKERFATKKAETKRNFTGSIITSVFATALGLVGYFGYGKQISKLETETAEREAHAKTFEDQTNSKQEERHKHAEQYKALQTEGVPAYQIMDYIASYRGRGVGLTGLSITGDLNVTLSGQATSMADLIQTTDTFQQCNLFHSLQLSKTSVSAPPAAGVDFAITAKTYSLDKILMPNEPKPKEPGKK